MQENDTGFPSRMRILPPLSLLKNIPPKPIMLRKLNK